MIAVQNALADSMKEVSTSVPLSKQSDLTASNATEEEKIQAMMIQSNHEFESNRNPVARKPICYHCGKVGHVIRSCPLIQASKPCLNDNLLENSTNHMNQQQQQQLSVPDYLLCEQCKDIMNDAVVISCCGKSFCDECIRNYLIDNQLRCPACSEFCSPDNLVPNIMARQMVISFKNKTITEHVIKPIASKKIDPAITSSNKPSTFTRPLDKSDYVRFKRIHQQSSKQYKTPQNNSNAKNDFKLISEKQFMRLKAYLKERDDKKKKSKGLNDKTHKNVISNDESNNVGSSISDNESQVKKSKSKRRHSSVSSSDSFNRSHKSSHKKKSKSSSSSHKSSSKHKSSRSRKSRNH